MSFSLRPKILIWYNQSISFSFKRLCFSHCWKRRKSQSSMPVWHLGNNKLYVSYMFAFMIIKPILELTIGLSNKCRSTTCLTFQRVQYPAFLSLCLVLGNTASAKQSLRLLSLQNLAISTLGNTVLCSLIDANNK